jgi:F-type H+-transporting ATPase subunit a
VSLWKLLVIKLQPDTIFTIGAFPVTNTLLCTWISIIVLVALFYFGTRRSDLIPSGLQNLMEWAVELLLGLVEGVSGKVKGKKFFPLVATFFLFILISNLLDVIPGVDTIGSIDGAAVQSAHLSCQPFLGFLPNCQPLWGIFLFGDLSNKIIPWIRPATSDLNLNFSMALIAVITAQTFGFVTLGTLGHLSKYFNVGPFFKALVKFSPLGMFQGFIEFFVGLLELLGELSRILSLAFRLFGNIFAGSAVLAVFAFILPFVADIAFIPLEMFVAFIQALVFALLALVYLEIATTGHSHSESEHEALEEYAQSAETEKAAA